MEHGGEASPGREGGSCRVRVRPADTVLGRGLMTSLRPAGKAVRAVSAFARHMTMALGMEHDYGLLSSPGREGGPRRVRVRPADAALLREHGVQHAPG